MAFHRVFHGLLRYVACGGMSGEDDSMDEEVAIEIEVGSVADAESRELEPVPRLDSLERGYQSVMQRALTFAHKWSQPDLHKRLLISSYPSSSTSSASQADSESDSEPGNGISLDVARDSSQARFEQLMQRTSRFYERCSMLNQQRALLHNGCNVPSY